MLLLRVVLLVLLVTAPAVAQTPFSAAITGTVRDETAGVLAGASVSISAPTLIGGVQAATTDQRGEYRFALLPPGVYDVSVSANAFRPARRAAVSVASGATVTIDFRLEVSGISRRGRHSRRGAGRRRHERGGADPPGRGTAAEPADEPVCRGHHQPRARYCLRRGVRRQSGRQRDPARRRAHDRAVAPGARAAGQLQLGPGDEHRLAGRGSRVRRVHGRGRLRGLALGSQSVLRPRRVLDDDAWLALQQHPRTVRDAAGSVYAATD